MNTRDRTLDQPILLPASAVPHAITEALRQFSLAPTVSNRVAAVTALQAWFAAVEQRREATMTGSA